MLLVSGGWTGDVRLDSTEIFDPDLGSWSAEAALPMKYGINGLKSATIYNRVFIFGKAFFAIYNSYSLTIFTGGYDGSYSPEWQNSALMICCLNSCIPLQNNNRMKKMGCS